MQRSTKVTQRRLVLMGVLTWLVMASGCGVWGNEAHRAARANKQKNLAPISVKLSAKNFAEELAETPFGPETRKRLNRFRRLTEVFYQQFVGRRINSKAAFDDPSLREFFEDSESFADYYADLVQSLADRHFEAIRPISISLRSYAVGEGADAVHVKVRFVGENSLPLRFWRTSYVREDLWVMSGEKWSIVPGKV